MTLLDASFSLKLQLVLEEIIGLTTKNANGLASSIKNGNCVYMAGYVAVVYNVDSGTQSHLMVSHRMPKPLNCVAVSQDGRFIAAGEVYIMKNHVEFVVIFMRVPLEDTGSIFALCPILKCPNNGKMLTGLNFTKV